MSSDALFIVMLKDPTPGRVKTRLVGRELDAERASAVAEALARCVVKRLLLRGGVALAVESEAVVHRLGLASTPGIIVTRQGAGDLGSRIERVWREIRPTGPAAFLGIDSPDVPAAALEAIPAALSCSQAAVGPTFDGGYWTLAANHVQPALLEHIDWGGPTVYDQTVRRALAAGISLTSLPTWHDVDQPADLEALIERLTMLRIACSAGLPDQDARILEELRLRLIWIVHSGREGAALRIES